MRQLFKNTFLFSLIFCVVATDKASALEKGFGSDANSLETLSTQSGMARVHAAEQMNEIAFMSQNSLAYRSKFERAVLMSVLGGLIAMCVAMWAIVLTRRNTRVRILYRELEKQNEALNKRTTAAEISLSKMQVSCQESHHRLKNNLHFLINLLEIQSSRLSSLTADQISSVLSDAANRVHAMAAVHEIACENDSGTCTSINDVLKNLVEQTFDVNNNLVTISVDCRDVEMNEEVSKSVVLIVNELLCNVQKHAFDGKTAGKVEVSLGKNGDNKTQLTVVDNGNGFSEDLLKKKKRSIGLKLVRSMVKQINGILNVDSGAFGTRWTINF